MNLNKVRQSKLPLSLRNRIAWTPVALSSSTLLLHRLQKYHLFGFKGFTVGNTHGKNKPKGFYFPLSLDWYLLNRSTDSWNINHFSENRVTSFSLTRPSVIKLELLFMKNSLVEQHYSQPRIKASAEKNVLSSPKMDALPSSPRGYQFSRNDQHAAMPKNLRRIDHTVIPNSTSHFISMLANKTILNSSHLILNQYTTQHEQFNVMSASINEGKLQTLVLQAHQSPRKETPVSQYRTVNQVKSEPTFRSSQIPVEQSFDAPVYNKQNPMPASSVKAQETNMVDQLFDLGMASIPIKGLNLREFSREQEAVTSNTTKASDTNSASSSTTSSMHKRKAVAIDSHEISQIADKVSRLLQQRERFERERKGHF